MLVEAAVDDLFVQELSKLVQVSECLVRPRHAAPDPCTANAGQRWSEQRRFTCRIGAQACGSGGGHESAARLADMLVECGGELKEQRTLLLPSRLHAVCLFSLCAGYASLSSARV